MISKRKLLSWVYGISACTLVYGWLQVRHVINEQNDLFKMAQIPFDELKWNSASSRNISEPNPRMAMHKALLIKWPKGTPMLEILLALRQPDSVLKDHELREDHPKTPTNALFAISYNYAETWDGYRYWIVFMFDSHEKLIQAEERSVW